MVDVAVRKAQARLAAWKETRNGASARIGGAAASFDDGFFDWIYIDARHDAAVLNMRAWYPKLKRTLLGARLLCNKRSDTRRCWCGLYQTAPRMRTGTGAGMVPSKAFTVARNEIEVRHTWEGRDSLDSRASNPSWYFHKKHETAVTTTPLHYEKKQASTEQNVQDSAEWDKRVQLN